MKKVEVLLQNRQGRHNDFCQAGTDSLDKNKLASAIKVGSAALEAWVAPVFPNATMEFLEPILS